MATTTGKIAEKDLQAAVVELAQYCGWKPYHTFDSRRSDPGFPDLVLVRRERLIFAELKSQTGNLTLPQMQWISALMKLEAPTDAAVQCFVWRPDQWLDGSIEACLK